MGRLYNPKNQSINISGWTIIDNSGEDEIEAAFDHSNGTMIIPPYFYAIITDYETEAYENFNIENNTISLCLDNKSIGNSGNKLILKNHFNETIDAVEWIINFSDVLGSPAKAVEETLVFQDKKNSS